MVGEGVHPRDMREALSIAPFLHLIPKQEIAPLISSTSITISPDPQEFNSQLYDSECKERRKVVNSDETSFGEVLKDLASEFTDCQDEEVDQIRFRKPEIIQNGEKQPQELTGITLPALERRIFNSTKIESRQIILSSRSADTRTYTGRLSVRKTYQAEDKQTKAHNDRYLRKYERELGFLFAEDKEFSKELPNSYANRKRYLEDDEEYNAKRPHRIVTMTYDQVADRANVNMAILLQQIEREEAEPEISANWMILDDTKILTNYALLHIHDNLIRNLNHRVLHTEDNDISYLSKIQDLCLRTINASENIDFSELSLRVIAPDLQDNDLASLIISLETCLNFTKASKIMLLLLTSHYSEKLMFYDAHTNSVIQLMDSVVDLLIIPLASFENVQPITNTLKPILARLLVEVCDLFQLFNSYKHPNRFDDTLITKLEYLCIHAVFAEYRSKGNNSFFGLSQFELLKLRSCEMIISLFSNISDQREFILGELISNFDKLSPNRTVARQYKLAGGGNVQLVSALLAKLIESSSADFDVSSLSESFIDSPALSNNVKESILNCKKTGDNISRMLISKFSGTTSTMSKQSLELMVEDLLSLMLSPVWAGSTVLLTSITNSFLIMINAEADPPLETTMLDMLGLIVLKIKCISCKKELKRITPRASSEDLNICKSMMINVLHELKSISGNVFSIASSQFLLLKYLSYFLSLVGDSENNSLLANTEVENLEVVAKQACRDLINATSDGQTNISKDASAYTENEYLSIMNSQELEVLYEGFLGSVVGLMDSNKVKVRAKCIKILSSLIEQNDELLLSPKIQESVSNRLFDNSPLVRDAVIDLIGRYMSSNPVLVDRFYKSICECLVDESVQVRKRVAKLSGQMYEKTTSKSVKVYISSKLIRKLNDEDDVVQDISRSILLSLWFPKSNNLEKVDSSKTTAEVMMDIVKSGGRTSEGFESFIINYVNSNNSQAAKVAMKLKLAQVFDFIIEGGDAVASAMKLVAMFVKCDSSIINQDQLVSLEPFFIEEKSTEGTSRLYGLEILSSALPSIGSLRPDFLASLVSNLLKKLTKYSVKELHHVVPSVWVLCQMNKDSIKLANATISCMRLIKPYFEFKEDKKFDVKLQKLLHLLGCFGRYCRLENHRDLFQKSSLGFKAKESVTSGIVKFLMYFCDSKMPSTIRNTALANMIHVCRTHTKLFVSEAILKVFDREMNLKSNVESFNTIIRGLFDFLKDEEIEVRRRVGSSSTSSDKLKIDISVFHGDSKSFLHDGICAGLIQRYENRILEMTLYDKGEQSYLAVQFVELIVKIGFSNPKLCIPTIIALHSSPNPYVRNIARQVHKELFEKHESLIDTSYAEGFTLSFNFSRRLSLDDSSSTEVFNSVYSIIQKTYSSRKKFINSLLRLLVVDLERTSIVDALEKLQFARNKVCNIAKINFATLEEVLMIVHEIDHVVSRSGMDLVDKLKTQTDDVAIDLVIAQSILAISALRSHLVNKFSLGRSLIDRFIPGKVDPDMRHAIKSSYQLPLEIPVLPETLEKSSLIIIVQNEVDKYA
ncbi:predicted protein [Scheffersomyces stipitis CBS 6054]|uniref:Sister chromatid cohesion protein n=1 Tax=Scheffersomyces stipitis (strain ATCC 58785 / CBS 6054 / NBRC 10063 / NRRL Y-11545) TaxID=322104 RepID=A3LZL4_PICST|nr:predicted protein [Scheffersomyces stipitis CBS 6054]ABN68178.2 predicted protein [Scheffersomyces stipitis CBS 6054]